MKKLLLIFFITFTSFAFAQSKTQKDNFQLAANPIEDVITINTAEENYTIELIDALGTIVYIEKNNKGSRNFDYSNFPSGIYILRVHTNENYKSLRIVRL